MAFPFVNDKSKPRRDPSGREFDDPRPGGGLKALPVGLLQLPYPGDFNPYGQTPNQAYSERGQTAVHQYSDDGGRPNGLVHKPSNLSMRLTHVEWQVGCHPDRGENRARRTIPERRAETPRMNTHNVRVHMRVIRNAKQRHVVRDVFCSATQRPQRGPRVAQRVASATEADRWNSEMSYDLTVQMHTRSKRSRRTGHTTGSASHGRQAEGTGTQTWKSSRLIERDSVHDSCGRFLHDDIHD